MNFPRNADPLLESAARELLEALDEYGVVTAEMFHGLTMVGLDQDEAAKYLTRVADEWATAKGVTSRWRLDGEVA